MKCQPKIFNLMTLVIPEFLQTILINSTDHPRTFSLTNLKRRYFHKRNFEIKIKDLYYEQIRAPMKSNNFPRAN